MSASQEREDNLELLAPDDLQFQEMQAVLSAQHRAQEEKLELEYQELRERQRQMGKAKEEVGVRLYTAQQQLAANQLDYEKAHDNFNVAQRLRLEAEQKLAQVQQLYDGRRDELGVLRGKVAKAQKELETLMRHYHEVEAYNLQMKSDIAVTKIETFTAEDSVSHLERLKKKQDLLIDSMNEESKRLEERKNLLAAQVISQREETEQARAVLREAEAEAAKVVASKKSLLEKWEKSVALMQRRDATVQTLKERLRDEREQQARVANELAGLRAELRKAEERTSEVTAAGYKAAKVKAQLAGEREELEREQEKVSRQLVALKDSLARTELDIKGARAEEKAVQESMELIEAHIMKLHTESKRTLERLVDKRSEHTTVEKTAGNLLKLSQKLQLEAREKEIELEGLRNEIARVRIDQLNTRSQIELLKQRRADELARQDEKNYLAITYDVQIKQGHDINEKKQHEVGHLNKLHDTLMSKAADENRNTEEAKLEALLRGTQEAEARSNELYRDWIKKQMALVHHSNLLQGLKDSVAQLQNKKAILEQKKARLSASHEAFEKEIAQIVTALKGLQQDMNKLNDTIALSSERRSKLENENVNLESEFVEKLKDMEREAIRLELSIDRIREEKADLLNEIVECERQILLWDRKLQLEQQMQEAVDPNVGQTEIEELKQTLHRSELRFNSLLKETLRIRADAKRAILKKADIELKYTASLKKDAFKKKDPETSKQLQSHLRRAKENELKIVRSLRDTEAQLAAKEGELESVAQAIAEAAESLRQLENEAHRLETDQLLAKVSRSMAILRISVLQKKYKKLSELETRTATLAFPEGVLSEKVGGLAQQNRDLLAAIRDFAERYSQYSEVLQPLLAISEIDASVN